MNTVARALSMMMMLTAAPLLGCGEPELGRAPDDADRADRAACPEDGSLAAAGVLALVNDAGVTVDELDRAVSQGGAGLYRTAARNIVAARPFDSMAELDAVPYVGAAACDALARYACNEQELCRTALPVVSWNIEHFPMEDRRTEDAVVELVETLQPAIIGVQEVEDREAFARVVDRLDGYEGIVAARGFFNRVAILYRRAAVELVDTEDLFVDDSYTFPRSVLAATFAVRGASEAPPVTFAVVHLKAFGDAESVARRRAAIEDLRDWVDDRRRAGEGEIVIVGDWNDRLTDEGADNVFRRLSEPSAHAQFLTQDAAEAGQSSYIPFPSLIDHIMVTDEVFDAWDYEDTEVLYLDETWSGDYEQTVSDHRPVRADFGVVYRHDG